eukprot:351640-Chlamydomonas_euryale.AAC.2
MVESRCATPADGTVASASTPLAQLAASFAAAVRTSTSCPWPASACLAVAALSCVRSPVCLAVAATPRVGLPVRCAAAATLSLRLPACRESAANPRTDRSLAVVACRTDAVGVATAGAWTPPDAAAHSIAALSSCFDSSCRCGGSCDELLWQQLWVWGQLGQGASTAAAGVVGEAASTATTSLGGSCGKVQA